ncbi:MAG: hypothetical protein V1831_02800 [Candidatus Woesearchaeota archaeon]
MLKNIGSKGYRQELELLAFLMFKEDLQNVLKSKNTPKEGFEKGFWVGISEINKKFVRRDGEEDFLFKYEKDTTAALKKLQEKGYTEGRDIFPKKKHKVRDRKQLIGSEWRINYQKKEKYLDILEIFYKYNPKLFLFMLSSQYNNTILVLASEMLKKGVDLTELEKEIPLGDILINEAIKKIKSEGTIKLTSERLTLLSNEFRKVLANEGLWQTILPDIWQVSPSFIYNLVMGKIDFKVFQEQLNLSNKEAFILLLNSYKITDAIGGITPLSSLNLNFFHYNFDFKISVDYNKNKKEVKGKHKLLEN